MVAPAPAVVFGLPLAFVLARRSFRGKWLVEACVDLPIVLPPSVAGLSLLLVLGRRGVLGVARLLDRPEAHDVARVVDAQRAGRPVVLRARGRQVVPLHDHEQPASGTVDRLRERCSGRDFGIRFLGEARSEPTLKAPIPDRSGFRYTVSGEAARRRADAFNGGSEPW